MKKIFSQLFRHGYKQRIITGQTSWLTLVVLVVMILVGAFLVGGII